MLTSRMTFWTISFGTPSGRSATNFADNRDPE